MPKVKEETKTEVRPLHHRVCAVPLHGHPPDGRLLQLDHDLQVADLQNDDLQVADLI